MRILPPLLPFFSKYPLKKQEAIKDLFFLNSGRSAFELIIKDLKSQYEHLIFLIPAYTCPSVVFALTQEEVEFDYVDLDESLDFQEKDLESLIEKYSAKKIVLVPTALLGIELREYKKQFSNVIVVEDRAQGELDFQRDSDYQFVSFGKGKLISAWNGGAVLSKSQTLKTIYEELPTVHGFASSFLLSLIQDFISKYLYIFIEKSFLNPEKKQDEIFIENTPFKISKRKINWILNSMRALDISKREKNTKEYFQKVDKRKLFSVKCNYLLRFPIKEKLSINGASHIYSYRYTYENAKRKRGKEMDVPRELAYNTTFLPTHDLVDYSYIEKVSLK